MKNTFGEFLDKIGSSFSAKALSGSLLQLTVRNFDQLSTLCDQHDIKRFDCAIRAIIIDVLGDKVSGEVYEYNKFYYILLDEVDDDIIARLSYKIHNKIISEMSINYLLDVRIVGIRLAPKLEIRKIVMLLADHVHYTDNSQVFNFITNPIDALNRIREDYELLEELRNSITSGSACFAFQPVIECKSGKVAYHECLLRLSNDNHKLISAGKYIMLAEKFGYITFVDKYVFEMAVEELKCSKDVILSVNISNIGVGDKLLVDHILKIIEEANVGKRLIIEITETAMNADYEQTISFMKSSKELGCKVALDDFGSGYTSFNQVRDYSIDVLKIDGSFIRDLDVNAKNKVLVETLIRTAEELGCKTVAEFVESGSVAKSLINLKVDYMQGNFFSPALNYRSWEKT